jgi:hypothetical protein
MPLPETFWAAIEKGVCDIDTNGKLRKLNISEKRQLLAILRKHEDCPDGWKDRKNMAPKKQKSIVESLSQAIKRLVDPEFKKKQQAASTRYNKRNRENGKKKEYDKRIRENGKQKAANDRNYKRRRENGKQQEYDKRYNADPINKDTKNARRRERYVTDINYRTIKILRSRLRHALGNNKKDHTIDLLGCTVEQMVQHIEKQFTPGMTWNNRGKADDEWEIDHIVPFAAFDLSKRDEQFIVCWYQNLQPLWGPDNRSKGGKYTEEDKQSLICKYNEHKK